jgi:hypothetical protein
MIVVSFFVHAPFNNSST